MAIPKVVFVPLSLCLMLLGSLLVLRTQLHTHTHTHHTHTRTHAHTHTRTHAHTHTRTHAHTHTHTHGTTTITLAAHMRAYGNQGLFRRVYAHNNYALLTQTKDGDPKGGVCSSVSLPHAARLAAGAAAGCLRHSHSPLHCVQENPQTKYGSFATPALGLARLLGLRIFF